MAKRWVSLLGNTYTSGYPDDGGDTSEVNFLRNATNSLEAAGDYPNLVTLAGSDAVLSNVAGLAVYGVRWTCAVDVAYAGNVLGNLADGRNFGNANPLMTDAINVRMVFDLPGNNPPAAVAFVAGKPPVSQYYSAQNMGRWKSVPPAWKWDRDGSASTNPTGQSLARALNYTPYRTKPGVPKANWYASGTCVVDLESQIPLGLMRPMVGEMDPGTFPGGIVTAIGMVQNPGFMGPAMAARFTRLDVLVNERPTWSLNAKANMTARGNDGGNVEFRAFHPGGEGISGLRVRIASANRCLSFQSGGAWANEVTLLTNSTGRIVVPVRPDLPGSDQIVVTSVDTPYVGGIFQPTLAATRGVQIANPSSGSGVVCTVIPAQQYRAGSPARIDRNSVLSWNAGANSIAEVEGDARLAFSGVGAVVGAVLGITDTRDAPEDVNRITHGFFFGVDSRGLPSYQLFEAGQILTEREGYTPATAFRLERAGGVVRYYVDDELIYTSTAPNEANTIYAACAVYASGDTLP